jgi:thiol-disulfide isomerase/thioredoxin
MRGKIHSGWTRAVLALAVAGGVGLGGMARGEDAATTSAPAKTAPASQPATRRVMPDVRPAVKDIMDGFKEAQAIVAVDGTYTDATRRAAALKKAGPALEKMLAGADNLKLVPQMASLKKEAEILADSMKAALGDEAIVASCKEKAAGTGADAQHARAVLVRGDYLQAGKDEAAQGKVIETFAKLIGEDPKNAELVYVLVRSHNETATTPKSADAIEAALKGNPTRDAKTALIQWAGDRKLAAMVNKPLVMKAMKYPDDGKEFSSDQYQGKVILVDFWATWCGPCIAGLPQVVAIYNKYHDKGLEVVGVSSDMDEEPLKDFLADHPDMTWVQLWNPKTPGPHPMGLGYGITSIPTMFLIDKKGVLRTVHAREEMDALIPKLLDEK